MAQSRSIADGRAPLRNALTCRVLPLTAIGIDAQHSVHCFRLAEYSCRFARVLQSGRVLLVIIRLHDLRPRRSTRAGTAR